MRNAIEMEEVGGVWQMRRMILRYEYSQIKYEVGIDYAEDGEDATAFTFYRRDGKTFEAAQRKVAQELNRRFERDFADLFFGGNTTRSSGFSRRRPCRRDPSPSMQNAIEPKRFR